MQVLFVYPSHTCSVHCCMPNHTGEPCSYKTMYVCHTMGIYLAWFRGNRYNTCYYEYRVSPYSRYIIKNMYWMYHSLIWHMIIEIRFQIWIFQYYMNLFTHIWQPLMYNNIDTRYNPAVYSLLASIHWSHYVQYSGKAMLCTLDFLNITQSGEKQKCCHIS